MNTVAWSPKYKATAEADKEEECDICSPLLDWKDMQLPVANIGVV